MSLGSRGQLAVFKGWGHTGACLDHFDDFLWGLGPHSAHEPLKTRQSSWDPAGSATKVTEPLWPWDAGSLLISLDGLGGAGPLVGLMGCGPSPRQSEKRAILAPLAPGRAHSRRQPVTEPALSSAPLTLTQLCPAGEPPARGPRAPEAKGWLEATQRAGAVAGPRSGSLRERASTSERQSLPWRRLSFTSCYPQPTGAGTASKWEQHSAGGPGGTPGPTRTLSVHVRGWSGLRSGGLAWVLGAQGVADPVRKLHAGSGVWGPGIPPPGSVALGAGP